MLNLIKHLSAFLCHALRSTDIPDRVSMPQPDGLSVYRQLDIRYGLAQRGINCYLFLRNPEQHAYWITFYFTNLALFKDRVGL